MNVIEKYNQTVKNYNNLADLVEKVYDKMKANDIVKVSKKKVMEDFDAYVQSILAVIAASDDNFEQIEFELLKQITRYHDIYKKYKSTETAKKEEVVTEAKAHLDSVPLFIVLLASADKGIENNTDTLCKDAFKMLLEIILDLSGIDGKVEDTEIQKAIQIIEPVIDYLNANQIKFF